MNGTEFDNGAGTESGGGCNAGSDRRADGGDAARPRASRITAADFDTLIRQQLPLACAIGYRIERLDAGAVTIRIPFKPDLTRPGGTVSGPVQLLLADLTMYGVVLSLIGRVEMAVTTNLNCNFLRRPGPADLIGDGRILKLGKRLAVGDVAIYSVGLAEPVAHATCTYSIPPPDDRRAR